MTLQPVRNDIMWRVGIVKVSGQFSSLRYYCYATGAVKFSHKQLGLSCFCQLSAKRMQMSLRYQPQS